MKGKIWLIGFIATIAIIGFLLTTCENGNGETHTHQWGLWKSNSTQHWKECSCGEEYGRANHNGNPCSVCDYHSGSSNGKISGATVSTPTLNTKTHNSIVVPTLNLPI